ncbi:transposase [Streptomyces sp. NPDC058305]|uniref:transposase n=1 Tax=Streptomyces sp. NPDC058305 TaxID=3346438 RepID=UPI0036E50F37
MKSDAFLRSPVARGLPGVRLVVSDAYAGLVNAMGATLPGASGQRCRTQYARTLPEQAPSRPSSGSPPCCGPSSNNPTLTP